MNPFAFRILMLLCAGGGLLLAQSQTVGPMSFGKPQTVRTMSFGNEMVLPGLLPPPPPQMEPVAYWSAYLNLDSAQQASVRTILAYEQSSAESLKANLIQAHNALRAAAKAEIADPDIDNLAPNVGTVFAQAAAAQAKAYTKFYALLTPDQKQKLDSFVAVSAGGGGGPITFSPGAAANQ